MSAAELDTRLTRDYGIRYPFVGAGMGFVAHPALVAAVTNAGGLGVLGASPDPPPSLPVMVEELHRLTSGPWGVDLICAETGMGPSTTDDHIQLCVDLGVSLVVFHHDVPPRDWVSRLIGAGARVWMQASSLSIAASALELGAVGIVAQGVEAGGHSRSTVPVLELVRGLRERYPDLLVLAAGGIADGAGVASALQAGADGAWVGTRLVASAEAHAHAEYKRRLVESSGSVSTTAYGPEWPDQQYRLLPVRNVREWAGREHEIPSPPPGPDVIGHTRLFPHSADQPYDMPKFSAVIPTPETTGDWEEMAFPAGEGVGRITAVQPVAEIVEEMMGEAQAVLAGQSASPAGPSSSGESPRSPAT